jgi:hypothetical protein
MPGIPRESGDQTIVQCAWQRRRIMINRQAEMALWRQVRCKRPCGLDINHAYTLDRLWCLVSASCIELMILGRSSVPLR